MASAVGGLWWRSIRPVPVRDRGIVGGGLLATGALSTAIDERFRLPGCLFRRHVIGLATIEPVKVEPCLWRREKQQAAVAHGKTDCSNNPRRGTEAAEADAGHVKGAADQHLRVSSVLRRRFRCPRLRPSVVRGAPGLAGICLIGSPAHTALGQHSPQPISGPGFADSSPVPVPGLSAAKCAEPPPAPAAAAPTQATPTRKQRHWWGEAQQPVPALPTLRPTTRRPRLMMCVTAPPPMQQRARRPGPDSRVRRRNRRILGITGVLANSFCLVFPRRRTESPDGTRSSAGPLPDSRHRFPWWTWLTLTKLVAVDSRPVTRPSNPYQPVGDYLSNVGRFKIIESTLREGEQFANAYFDTETKIKIAKALDDFGVDYIELTSPAASEQSRLDCEAICKLGLKAKILTHVRCDMRDAKLAVETGVDGLDIVIGTSSFLREHSHGKDMAYITKTALEVIEFVKSKGLEVRFSSEDSFRSDLVDLLSLYSAVDKAGVNRVGIADTVGCASPRQVYDLVRTLRGVVSCDIETHFHNDTGCAIANAFCALEAGATHVDTSVLGIGERNGITPLGGLLARMLVTSPDYVKSKYKLHLIKEIEDLVAEAVEVNTPFNNPITGFCAFTHKAGIHAKAILNNPSTYEILNPEDFGLTRYVHFASRLTGWNAVKTRVGQLGLVMTDDQVKEVTAKIKALADVRPIAIDDADSIIRSFHLTLQNGHDGQTNGAAPAVTA
ncbi:hypothetical protein Purlil1_6462 [Purpureocillium lilacinum]|uniref:homocitrate synthase n=1 Tax=Purpureocillium lilacinum TaxID=33203 RepID=A0ABR0BYB6_PURLI|nr:hypothetical protein Purlil1_6462 [Purpureocillium lilacinum]